MNLMAKIQIASQSEHIHQLFHFKFSENQDWSLFDAFIKYYKEQIEIAKKQWK